MSSVQKRIDFSCLDEAEADIECVEFDEIKNELESRHHNNQQQQHEEDTFMSSILTSSPLSKKLLLQSPRKVKRHIQYSFKAMTDTESCDSRHENVAGLPPSPLSSRLLPETASSGDVNGYLKPIVTNPLTYSPPYKRVRALRLLDTPITPKTIYEKSSALETPEPTPLSDIHRFRSRLFRDTPRPVSSAFARLCSEKPVANVNPFTPAEILRIRKRKRTINSLPTSPKSGNNSVLSSSDESMQQGSMREDEDAEVPVPVAKRIAINESNISRYYQEFHELELIGEGEFGSVHKCINRLDGCLYAVKRSIRPVTGSADEIRALNEVYAHAVLGSHRHVVRYFSAWAEDNHMIIQNEYCSGGSLAEKLEKLRAQPGHHGLPECELKQILLHVANGLHFIHHAGLVHLDIKPGNIFISHEPRVVPVKLLDNSAGDASLEELERQEEEQQGGDHEDVVYKIGDLGHVTCLDEPKVEEGDCRYLPKEILQEDFSHLTKADIFSFGLTVFEAAGAGPLPKNGEVWQQYREEGLPYLPYLSPGLNQLLKWMSHPVAAERPSASQVASHPQVAPAPAKLTPREIELKREVNKQRLQSEILQRQLQDANRLLMSNMSPALIQQAAAKSKRLVGLKVKRSMSLNSL